MYATSLLDDMGIKYLQGGNAGFFLWVDLSAWMPPDDGVKSVFERQCVLAQKFVDGGVFLQPVEEHGREGWWRMMFTMERRVVKEGLERVGRVLGG